MQKLVELDRGVFVGKVKVDAVVYLAQAAGAAVHSVLENQLLQVQKRPFVIDLVPHRSGAARAPTGPATGKPAVEHGGAKTAAAGRYLLSHLNDRTPGVLGLGAVALFANLARDDELDDEDLLQDGGGKYLTEREPAASPGARDRSLPGHMRERGAAGGRRRHGLAPNGPPSEWSA